MEVSNIYYREETVSVHKKSNNELNFSSLKKKMPIYCQQVDYGKAKRVLEEK